MGYLNFFFGIIKGIATELPSKEAIGLLIIFLAPLISFILKIVLSRITSKRKRKHNTNNTEIRKLKKEIQELKAEMKSRV